MTVPDSERLWDTIPIVSNSLGTIGIVSHSRIVHGYME
jgi:hypothetical protein